MRFSAVALAAALLWTSPSLAQTPTPAASPSVTVRQSHEIDFTAKANGKAYRLFIAMPLVPPPPGGYPVVYVLDGNAYFGTVTEAVRNRSTLGQEIAPAIVVGIGYPTDNIMKMMGLRFYDLTPVAPTAAEGELMEKSMKAMGVGPMEYGGADALVDTIEKEIKPLVSGLAPVNPRRSVLLGHSLGGLAVLNALFKHPEAFDAYIAISPSIWWAGRDILKAEPGLASKLAGGLSPRLYISVGSLEQQVPDPLPPGYTREDAEKNVNQAAMVDNAAALAQRLQRMKAGPGYKVVFKLFEGDTHLSVPWTSLKSALDLALPVAPVGQP